MKRLWLLFLAGCSSTSPAPLDCASVRSPIEYGRCQLARSQEAAHDHTSVDLLLADNPAAQPYQMMLDARPESFVIATAGARLVVVGRDQNGVLYGALELAEALDGGHAIAGYRAKQRPATALRGANFFMTLPDAGEEQWWFLDDDFWQRYLDLLARARINLLNLHGMYNLANTIFPNALLYFASSASHPDLGAPERERNLAMLQKIVQLAALRGIQVDFMTYRSDLDLTGNGPSSSDDPRLPTYIREATQDLATRVPGLYSLGFRIGESTHDAAWYSDTFIAGALAGGSQRISTRTWLANKPAILQLSAAAQGQLLIEAKYNGEQLGPPYIVPAASPVGLRGVSSYFYEDYLQEPAPYQFIFQIWASGTHRFFSHASFARVQRIARLLGFSPHVAGMTLQPSHAYNRQRDYYHADAADGFSPWTFERDDLEYLLFGRLAYNPELGELPFRDGLRLHTDTDELWAPLQAASEIVPWIQTAHTCGADTRDIAVELEWIGTLEYWASPATAPHGAGSCGGYHGPLDTFSLASPEEAAQDLVAGIATSRLRPQDVAALLLDAAATARTASAHLADSNARAREVARVCVALADLGEYAAHKLRGAAALAVYAHTASADYLAQARSEVVVSTAAWATLAGDTAWVAPFSEELRMTPLGYSPFHWRGELPHVQDLDAASVDAVTATPFVGALPAANDWLALRKSGPGLTSLEVTPKDPAAPSWTVIATLGQPLSASARARVWWRAFPSTAAWQSVTASAAGTTLTASVPGTAAGALFAVEIFDGGSAWRYPDPVVATPYVALPPR